MSLLRWLLVSLFYVAAELSSPVMSTPVEAFDGETEEAIHRAGRSRDARLAPARRPPAPGPAIALLRRPEPTSVVTRVRTHDPAARRIPATPGPDPAASPEDH